MSDPIGNIIWGEDYFSNPHDDEITKKVRQQIGRELLEKEKTDTEHGINNAWDWSYVHSGDIREVCQLEES